MAITQTLLQFPQQFFANDGTPLNGGSLTFYVGGTVNTPQNTYSDQALTVLNPNPLPLNSAGFPIVSNTEVKIYPISAAYKIVVKDSSGTVLHTWDNVEPNAPWNLSNGASVTITGGTLTGSTLVSPIIGTSLITTSALLADVCEGRLTGTSGTPVTVSDVTNITTIYFTPYKGNNIGLYDGSSKWTVLPFSEISIALGTLTSGLPYDIFAFNNSGVVALRSPVAWTNTTTRATALVLQNGIWVKTGATTDRYLGTFYTTSTTQTQDTAAQRLVYNYYNRVPRPVTRVESTASWTYTTATWRQANGATANQIAIVQGVAETAIDLRLTALVNNSTGGVGVAIAIGAADSTTTPITNGIVGSLTAQNGINVGATASATTIPAVGYHFYAGLEESTATGTTTWIGSGTLAGVSVSEWGLTGLWTN